MSADLIRQKARERHFLEQLLDGRKLENYKIPVPIKAELRKYQQVCMLVLRPIKQIKVKICWFGPGASWQALNDDGTAHTEKCPALFHTAVLPLNLKRLRENPL